MKFFLKLAPTKLMGWVTSPVWKVNSYLQKNFHRDLSWTIAFVVTFVLFIAIGIGVKHVLFWTEFWDDDESRGAVAMSADAIDDRFEQPVYLRQGWDASESLWFYNVSLGSNLLPYDFFMVLEQADNGKLFRSNENIRKFRYLTQQKTSSNPDVLPLGFVKDHYLDKNYLGFSCAACHTAQVNYGNTAIRIDGGPTMADMEGFMSELSAALTATLSNKEKYQRFVGNVLAVNSENWLFTSGDYDNEEAVRQDLETYERMLRNYNTVNHADVPYGYGRLDAFGRIYNRIAEHVINKKTLYKILTDIVDEGKWQERWKHIVDSFEKQDKAESHLVDWATQFLSKEEKAKLFKVLYSKADAPVNYPHLWDAVQHDYVQWNAVVDNSGIGGLGRNVSQILGVFATLDWEESYGYNLSAAVIGRQRLDNKYIDYQSSLNIEGLSQVETQLEKLRSPQWPDIFPPIDTVKQKQGKVLYQKYCQECHASIDREDPDRRVIAHLSDVDRIKTDPKMAENSYMVSGYSGIVQGQYYKAGASDMGKAYFEEKAPMAEILATAATNSAITPDKDKFFLNRWMERVQNIIKSYFDNPVKSTIKRGDYQPDTSANPYASLHVYKARPLNGIWATAPFLHNGSVPTLYHLLLPCAERPAKFSVGSFQFDPKNVGYVYTGEKGSEFNTEKPGNSNCGHEYAAGVTQYPNGDTKVPLTEGQRQSLLEYLKTL